MARERFGLWTGKHHAFFAPATPLGRLRTNADAERPDLRFFGVGFDAPVPAELKLADKWTGSHLFARLEVQLCGDYLRDIRSSRGIFMLVHLGTKSYWDLPNGRRADTFEMLLDELQRRWTLISGDYPGVEDIRAIGIDLTQRGIDAKTAKTTKAAKAPKAPKAVKRAAKPLDKAPKPSLGKALKKVKRQRA